MLIRHLIQKLDDFKICNLNMDSAISPLQENNWKLEGEKVTGPKMKIKELPVIQFNLIFGL